MAKKKLSSPFQSGNGGAYFEAHIQAHFVVLMLTSGCAPCLPCWPISKIKLQGKIDDYETDDVIVFTEDRSSQMEGKLLGQIKHFVKFTPGNPVLKEVLEAAWGDFNNTSLFSKDIDAIALITGPLTEVDSKAINWILTQAKKNPSTPEFLKNVTAANYSPSKTEEKLNALKLHLKNANHGKDLSDEELHSFLKSFYVISYDLGEEVGGALSLIHSHISVFSSSNPKLIWGAIVDLVQNWNQSGGTITHQNIPSDILEHFKECESKHFPANLVPPGLPENIPSDFSALLTTLNLVGSWDESNAHDIEVLESLSSEQYSNIKIKLKQLLQFNNSPISLNGYIWKVKERKQLWSSASKTIFNDDLDRFKSISINILSEKDPKFELPINEQFMATSMGKKLSYSEAIRQGVSETLALLGNEGNLISNIPFGKDKQTTVIALRQIFENADWQLWATLNLLLPTLSEADGKEFLAAVDASLKDSSIPFKKIFSLESSDVFGSNYMTGLLWALENLAWNPDLLTETSITLGELAILDPGGNWANRPQNSLRDIFLPWHPQTLADIKKRKTAISILKRELPSVTWKLLLSLLPDHFSTTSGTSKPKFQTLIPKDWKPDTTVEDYWNQVTFYSELLIDMANGNIERSLELINRIDDLPENQLDKFLKSLSSFSTLPETEKYPLWDALYSLVVKHKKFSDADWALAPQALSKLEQTIEALAPVSTLEKNKYLFSNRDYDLYEDKGDFELQRKGLETKRINAIEQILRETGIEGVLKFLEIVENSGQVGYCLSQIHSEGIEETILPKYLSLSDENSSEFITSFINGKIYKFGWEWADAIDQHSWNKEHILHFLLKTPFSEETWNRLEKWIPGQKEHYWKNARVCSYVLKSQEEYNNAVKNLIKYKRPLAAVSCLNAMKHKKLQPLTKQIIAALQGAQNTSEQIRSFDTHEIIELIKLLQKSEDASEADVFAIEWSFLPLLERHNGAIPIITEIKLANEPDFFDQIIQILYKPRHQKEKKQLSENEQNIAKNAWQLLHHWSTVPGTQKDGSFNENAFKEWMEEVIKKCTKSDRIEVALNEIGKVLIRSPVDNEGLWINKTIAEKLNDKDMEELRNGFRMGLFNSRGVHTVDPTGAPEKELAKKYRTQASDVEDEGFFRLATTLRKLAESYDLDAKRVASTYQDE